MQIWAERIAQAAADDAPAPDGWETTTDADAHLDAGDGGGGGGGGSGGAACDGIQDWVAGNKIVRSGFLDKHRDASWKARWCELALEAGAPAFLYRQKEASRELGRADLAGAAVSRGSASGRGTLVIVDAGGKEFTFASAEGEAGLEVWVSELTVAIAAAPPPQADAAADAAAEQEPATAGDAVGSDGLDELIGHHHDVLDIGAPPPLPSGHGQTAAAGVPRYPTNIPPWGFL